MVNVSAALRTLAGALMKIANDVRLYVSGPRAGIGELRIPENEPGSSIMPGKINPDPVRSPDHGRGAGVRQRPVRGFRRFARAISSSTSTGRSPCTTCSNSIQLLAEGCRSFDEHCARGIEPNEKRIKEHLDNSLMLVTALNPHIGYEKAAQISLKAYREDISLREAALALGFVTGERVRQVGPPRGHDASAVNAREEEEVSPARPVESPRSRGSVFKTNGRKFQINQEGNSKPREAKSKYFSSANLDFSRA